MLTVSRITLHDPTAPTGRPQWYVIETNLIYADDSLTPSQQPPPLRAGNCTLTVSVNALNQRLQHCIGLVIADLASTSRIVAATVVFEHQVAHMGFAATIEDGLARG